MLAKVGFIHHLEILDKNGDVIDDTGPIENVVPFGGIEFLISSPFGDAAPIPTFYCGLFTKNFVPDHSTSVANLQRDMGELINIEEASRPTWDRVYDNGGGYNNYDSPAIITPTQDVAVYGSFVISSDTKGGTNGLLISVARFQEVKRLTALNPARLKTSLTYTSREFI